MSDETRELFAAALARKHTADKRNSLAKWGLPQVGGAYGRELSEAMTRDGQQPRRMNRHTRRYAARYLPEEDVDTLTAPDVDDDGAEVSTQASSSVDAHARGK